MAKTTENKTPVVPIDYIGIIEEMSEDAFKFCVDTLYPLFKYRVLKQGDVRRIDLEEKLLEYNSQIPKDDNGQEQGALNLYLNTIKMYFDSFIRCQTGSQAAKYRSRALDLIKIALSDKGSIEDVEDIVQIFIAFFRISNGVSGRLERIVIGKSKVGL